MNPSITKETSDRINKLMNTDDLSVSIERKAYGVEKWKLIASIAI